MDLILTAERRIKILLDTYINYNDIADHIH